jgi:hypothetical protein
MFMKSKSHFRSCWILGYAGSAAHPFLTKTMLNLGVRRCDPSFPAFLAGSHSLREA